MIYKKSMIQISDLRFSVQIFQPPDCVQVLPLCFDSPWGFIVHLNWLDWVYKGSQCQHKIHNHRTQTKPWTLCGPVWTESVNLFLQLRALLAWSLPQGHSSHVGPIRRRSSWPETLFTFQHNNHLKQRVKWPQDKSLTVLQSKLGLQGLRRDAGSDTSSPVWRAWGE